MGVFSLEFRCEGAWCSFLGGVSNLTSRAYIHIHIYIYIFGGGVACSLGFVCHAGFVV